jgi:hypothetical protein
MFNIKNDELWNDVAACEIVGDETGVFEIEHASIIKVV